MGERPWGRGALGVWSRSMSNRAAVPSRVTRSMKPGLLGISAWPAKDQRLEGLDDVLGHFGAGRDAAVSRHQGDVLEGVGHQRSARVLSQASKRAWAPQVQGPSRL